MKVAVFSSKPSTQEFFDKANTLHEHDMHYLEARLSAETVSLAQEADAVCCFVNDTIDKPVLTRLSEFGIKLVALRCAGYNNVDLKAARDLGICICRVPAYSPHAVAEHAVGLMLALNRRIHRANARVREGNFSLEGLLGFDMFGKTAGIVGTGNIGKECARILQGFGMEVLAFDPNVDNELEERGVRYVELDNLYKQCDVITLHCPLMPATYHMINGPAVDKMKDGVMLINTSRGALIDTPCVIEGLKSGKIGYLGLDVYEEEGDLFFEDLSDQVLQDDVFARLLTFPNVIITGHQAYFTKTALENIADTTMGNISAFEMDGTCQNMVKYEEKVKTG